MRSHLFDPTEHNVHLNEAIALAQAIYALHEAGADYSAQLKRLCLISGHPIHILEVQSAIDSISPETFARNVLIDWNGISENINNEELLEMIDRICNCDGDEFQMDYWIECVRVNTRDENVSDLIFWPGTYFGDGDDSRSMSPSEILATALESGSKQLKNN